jgi:phosphoglycolate phosphatase
MAKTTLITDFDNTLYDWFHMWHQSFSPMLREIVAISGISKEELLPEIRRVHQRHGTSEYAFLIQELPSLARAFPGEDLSKVFDSAIHVYRSARKASLHLYAGVAETIAELRASGVLIVLYTDSLAYYTNYRIRRLGLDGLVDFVFSPPDHDLPEGVTSHVTKEDVRLSHAKHLYLPAGVRKPNPAALLDIVRDVDRSRSTCLYLGDSLKNDIAMAQDADITDVLASYGSVQHMDEYELLRMVSHWTEADVQREKAMSQRDIKPTHVISKFSEIKQFF